MASGIIIIDKPPEWTSHDVVRKLRRLLGEKRIGHAGTLDPMATGVLPVFVGRATRAVEFAENGEKEYLAVLRLGVTTDTQDTTGAVVETHPVSVTEEELERVLSRFRGDILQIPPMYSALKVGGKKLYELARQGKTVERSPRPVTVFQLEVTGRPAPEEISLRVVCSKGTYIRTLCHDIGAQLGCGGAMAALRRTRAAGFDLSRAVTLEEVARSAESGEVRQLLFPVDTYFEKYPAHTVNAYQERKCRNGAAFPTECPDGEWRVYSRTGEFLMLGRADDGVMTTVKSFFSV